MATVLVILAPGAEEIETMTVADVLVRAGQQVLIASTTPLPQVLGSRGLPLGAHTTLDALGDRTFDLVYLPGGLGSATTMRDDARVQALMARQLASGRTLAIICASAIALVPNGLGVGRRVTSFPGVRAQVEPHVGAWLDQAVVEDGNLVTSQAAGTAMALGLTLARRLAGGEISAKLAQDMLATPVA